MCRHKQAEWRLGEEEGHRADVIGRLWQQHRVKAERNKERQCERSKLVSEPKQSGQKGNLHIRHSGNILQLISSLSQSFFLAVAYKYIKV